MNSHCQCSMILCYFGQGGSSTWSFSSFLFHEEPLLIYDTLCHLLLSIHSSGSPFHQKANSLCYFSTIPLYLQKLIVGRSVLTCLEIIGLVHLGSLVHLNNEVQYCDSSQYPFCFSLFSIDSSVFLVHHDLV